jgi:replicative superfamily II helicase
LPCHFVIIKNTMNWQTGGLREYADLEIMQMLGRAGRYRKRSIPSIFARLTFGRYN